MASYGSMPNNQQGGNSVRFQSGEKVSPPQKPSKKSPSPQKGGSDSDENEAQPLIPETSSKDSLFYFDTQTEIPSSVNTSPPRNTIGYHNRSVSDLPTGADDDDLSYDGSIGAIGIDRLNTKSSSIDGNEDPHDNDNDDLADDDDMSIDTYATQIDEADIPPILRKLRQKNSPFFCDKRPVLYDDNSHFHVITQVYGSVWPYVMPYCLLNIAWTYCITYLKNEKDIDLTIPSSGHKFMTILVSFLVVSRVQITYGRFMESRNYLGSCFRSSRELLHNMCVFTLPSKNREAVHWRRDVAEKILKLLRITIAAVEFSSRGESPWDSLTDEQRGPDTRKMIEFLENHHRFARNEMDEALRAPILYATILRAALLSPRKTKCLDVELIVGEEMKLIGCVNTFTTAFHGLNKVITTPFPFPLVQKTRTILFFWLYTLPLAVVRDFNEVMEVMIIVAFITYGFLGLEYVSIELDDPFGQDPNDFNSLGMAQKVYEDIYLTLLNVDGKKSAEKLRKYMVVEDDTEEEELAQNMKDWNV